MKVRVKLFATFQEYLPEGTGLDGIEIEIKEGSTLKDIYQKFNLPEKIQKITLVEGKHQKEDYVVNEGETISVFPPIAGG
jgi:molybdopterin converting factor small subunit